MKRADENPAPPPPPRENPKRVRRPPLRYEEEFQEEIAAVIEREMARAPGEGEEDLGQTLAEDIADFIVTAHNPLSAASQMIKRRVIDDDGDLVDIESSGDESGSDYDSSFINDSSIDMEDEAGEDEENSGASEISSELDDDDAGELSEEAADADGGVEVWDAPPETGEDTFSLSVAAARAPSRAPKPSLVPPTLGLPPDDTGDDGGAGGDVILSFAFPEASPTMSLAGFDGLGLGDLEFAGDDTAGFIALTDTWESGWTAPPE